MIQFIAGESEFKAYTFSNLNMKSQENIEILIEKIRLFMPSSGSWPVTVINIKRDELMGLSFEPDVLSAQQLLFLIRTDFDRNDLIDYISNTEEFLSIPITRKDDYLNHYVKNVTDNSDIIKWSEKIASLSIGLAIQLSENLDLCIEPIEAELCELNNHFRFSHRNLKAYQLFDIYTCSF